MFIRKETVSMTPSNRNNAPHKTIKKKSQSKSLDVPKLHQRSRQCEEYTGFINPYFIDKVRDDNCLLYTSPSPRDRG